MTVFGESADANAVLHLMATPAAAGLFARAIAQSPPTSASFSQALTDGWASEFVAELRSLRTDASALSPHELLTSAPVADLTRAAVALQARTPDANPGTFCLIPVIDGDFLPERVLDAFRRGTEHRVPLIIGTNEREGSLFRGRVDILPQSPMRIAAIFDHAPLSSHDAVRLLGGRELFINAGERMLLHWLRFACTGRPDDTWPAYSESDRLTLIIDEVDRIESDPRGERRAVWQEFLPNF